MLPRGKRGETLAEAVAAVEVAALALSMLLAALSVSMQPKKKAEEERRGVVSATFELGEHSYSAELDVTLHEEGYTYARE